MEGLEVLGIDVKAALEKLERKREEWTQNEKLAEMELGEAGCFLGCFAGKGTYGDIVGSRVNI